ncbi:hypothetical protein COO91_05888 [Nostoc flagelliforme CCNUN1]|uniref:Uncharacterized protein n=1 Tax=Nostoc flagelliforme CCNUN1 TaxID=2038116 RepID=A0A2K8SWQ6_9NOSO|nr:hypothetical protein COO91_05888 [Nostoc flagelliforme CCNUN1]
MLKIKLIVGVKNKIFKLLMPTAGYAHTSHLKASFILTENLSTMLNLILINFAIV